MSEKLPALPPLDKPAPHPWEAWPFGAFPIANERSELVRAELCAPSEPVTFVRMEICAPAKPPADASKGESPEASDDVR